MIKRERKFYSEEFKERVLTTYLNSDEQVTAIARRFGVNQDTVKSWVYRGKSVFVPNESVNFASLEPTFMKKQELSTEQMEARIRALERELSTEKMRSQCLDRMIEIAEQELKIDIRKKYRARQSMR